MTHALNTLALAWALALGAVLMLMANAGNKRRPRP